MIWYVHHVNALTAQELCSKYNATKRYIGMHMNELPNIEHQFSLRFEFKDPQEMGKFIFEERGRRLTLTHDSKDFWKLRWDELDYGVKKI